MGVYGENLLSFVVSSWNFVPGYIKNVDTHFESFSLKIQVIKKLSPESLWKTYMKWTVASIVDQDQTGPSEASVLAVT